MTKLKIRSGTDLRNALDAAERLGCTVRRRRGTGELIVSHPSWPRSVRVSSGRRDCPRLLTVLLRQLSGD
jgi:hypothetical protein